MPSWPIHFKIADRMSRLFDIRDYDSYLFGSVMPDVPKRLEIPKQVTHYYNRMDKPNGSNEDIVDIERFEEDYADVMDNPLVLGYYIHLLTDYYFNRYVNFNKWIDKDNLIGYYTNTGNEVYVNNHSDRVHAKRHDFELFGKKLFSMGVSLPKTYDETLLNARDIKNFYLPDEEIISRVEYLNSEFKDKQKIEENENYIMFDDEELDMVLNNCLMFIQTRLYEKHILDGKDRRR